MDKYQRTWKDNRPAPNFDEDTPTGGAIAGAFFVAPFLVSALIVFGVLGYCFVKSFVEG